MRRTIPHYYDFKDKASLVGKNLQGFAAWDRLRIQEDVLDVFSIPLEARHWQAKCLRDALLDRRAEAIASLLDPSVRRVHSYGTGTGCLEYLLKRKKPDVFLQCSDFTPQAMGRLKQVFREADEILIFDMFKDQWVQPREETLHLFHRVDTEFSDRQWQLIFEKMQKQGIQNVLFIPSRVLTVADVINIQIKNLLYKILRRDVTFAGYLRTNEQWHFIFEHFYHTVTTVKIGDLDGYLLKLKN